MQKSILLEIMHIFDTHPRAHPPIFLAGCRSTEKKKAGAATVWNILLNGREADPKREKAFEM